MPVTELPVRTEAHVKVALQIKDITVFVLQASPQLTAKKVFATNGSTGAWVILPSFILFRIFHLFIIIVSRATRRLGDEQARLLRLESINRQCLPCHWCRMEENIIEKRKKKKERREKEREREKKKWFIYFSRRLIKRSH